MVASGSEESSCLIRTYRPIQGAAGLQRSYAKNQGYAKNQALAERDGVSSGAGMMTTEAA